MKIEFLIDVMDERYNSRLLTENEIESKLDSLGDKLGKGNSQEGFIRITASSQAEVNIYDALWHLAKNLCFEFVFDTLFTNKNTYTYDYYVMDNYLVLTDSLDLIKVIGDDEDVPAAFYPKDEFLRHLYKCGKRILDFLGRLGFHEGVIPLLKEAEVKTRNTLIEHGLLK